MHPTSLISVLFSYLFSGVTPAEAEMNYLNTAKMLDLYGVDIHTVMVSYQNTVFILLVLETTSCILLLDLKVQYSYFYHRHLLFCQQLVIRYTLIIFILYISHYQYSYSNKQLILR